MKTQDQIIVDQGWNDKTVLDFALRFIKDYGKEQAWIAYLNALALQENSTELKIWEQIVDICNCSTMKAKQLVPRVEALIQMAWSVDRAIYEVLHNDNLI